MSDIAELVKRLRDVATYIRYDVNRVEDIQPVLDAATALEAQAAEIQRMACDQLTAEGQLMDEIGRLRKAILIYGWHEPSCPFLENVLPCMCGFESIRAALSPLSRDTKTEIPGSVRDLVGRGIRR